MDSLTPEQRQKVNDLVPGKYYKIMPSEVFPERRIYIARFRHFGKILIMGGGHVPVLKFGGYPVFTQIKPGSCEFHTDNEEVYEMIHEKEIDYISPIEAPRGWSPSKKEISAMVCPPDNAVNEPLGAEEWAAREAAREAVLAPWSKLGETKTPKKMTALERMVARKRKTTPRATTAAPVTGGGSAATPRATTAAPVTGGGSAAAPRATTAAPVTGGGSAAATSSKKKKTPSERLNRKTRKVSRR